MRKIYLVIIVLLVNSLPAVAQLPILFYDFESNSNRSSYQNSVEQSVNTGNSSFTRTGTSSITGGPGAGIFNSGNSSGQALSVTNIASQTTDPVASATSYLQFIVNTSGFKDISLEFDIYAFGPGSNYPFVGALVSYNGGSTFSSLISGFNPSRDSWSLRSGSFSSLADNKTNLIIRIYGYHSNNNSVGGFRIDNVTVYAQGTELSAGTKNMLDEEDIYTSKTSGLSGSMYPRLYFTASGAGTTINLPPVNFSGKDHGTAATLNIVNNAILNLQNGSLLPVMDSTHGSVAVSSINVSAGTFNFNTTMICLGDIIQTGGTINLNVQTLKLGGNITKTAGVFSCADATLEMIGSKSQSINGTYFLDKALNNIVISNSGSADVSLSGELDIYGRVSFTGTGRTFNTNGFLTLKSNVSGTAEVAEIAVNSSGVALNKIEGNVTVERYISAKKAWRFLSVPTNTTQTIKQAWQENQPANNTALSGFGIQITGNMANWATNGFDLFGGGNAAIKTYHPTLFETWESVSSTLSPIKTNRGYMTFIRGDRTANAYNSVPTATVLRTKGELYTGDQPPINVGLNLFTAVGNPYASRLDLRMVNTSSIADVFYVWDPKLGTIGGYQTFIPFLSNYFAFPGGGSYNPWFIPSNYVESGQAFFITTTSILGQIQFKENAKSSGSDVVSRNSMIGGSHLVTTLSDVNDNVLDAVICQFDNAYKTGFDKNDIRKMSNMNESLSLMVSDSMLVLNRRPEVTGSDTIHLKIKNVKQGHYSLSFIENDLHLSIVTAFLEDSYTGTSTLLDLSDSGKYSFTVNSLPASWKEDRFMIVFRPAPATVNIISVSAVRHNDNMVSVSWRSENETAIARYILEHGFSATKLDASGELTATGNNGNNVSYTFEHNKAHAGENFYRVKAIGHDGRLIYSSIVSVDALENNNTISVYPNPVVNRRMNILFSKEMKGDYDLSLISASGNTYFLSRVNANEEKNHTIQLAAETAPGIYRLKAVSVSGGQLIVSVNVL